MAANLRTSGPATDTIRFGQLPPLVSLGAGQDRRAGRRWQEVPGAEHTVQLGVDCSVVRGRREPLR